MKTIKVLLGISCFYTLSGMEDHQTTKTSKKEVINFLRNEIIRKNGEEKKYTPHQRESFKDSYHIAADHSGHQWVLPQSLVKKDSYIFNGPKISTDEHHTSDTYKISPDKNHVAQILTSNNFQDTVVLTDLANQSKTTLFNNQPLTMAICFSPDSSRLFTGGTAEDKKLQEWNTSTQQLITEAPHPATPITAITFNSTGNIMVACGNNNTNSHIQIWQKDNVDNNFNKKNITLRGGATITHAYFNNANDTILVTMMNGVMVLLNASDGTMITSLQTTDSTQFTGVVYPVFILNDQFLITINHRSPLSPEKNSFITLWETKKYTRLSTLKTNLLTCGIGLTPDKRSIVATFEDLTMHKTDLFDDETYDCLRHLKKNNGEKLWAALCILYSYQKSDVASRNENISAAHEALQNLPTEPNIREMVQHYFGI